MNKVFLRSSMDESSNDTTKMDESRLSNKEYDENQIASNAFWYTLQDEKGIEIPPYVKNICTFNNLDNPLTFRHITDDTIKELEDFAQNQMKDFLQPGDNYELYFGRYHKMPDKFRFLIGDRFLIKELVEFVKSKPDQFWKTSVPLPTKKICLRNYVSSDNEDDELQTSTPPNPEKESKELTLLAKRALMKENFGSKAKNQAMLNKVEAKVTVKTIAGGPKGVDTFIMTGTVKCVLCSQKLVIRKTFASGTKKPRWVASNYRRHIRYHLDGRLKRMMPELPEASTTEEQLDAITTVICKSEEFVDADQDTEDTTMHEEETFVETW